MFLASAHVTAARYRDMLSPLSLHEQKYAKSFQALFMKPHRIMDYCYAKNPLNFGLDRAQNDTVAAIWEFCLMYYIWTTYDVESALRRCTQK